MVETADNSISALVVDLADMSCFEATAYELTEKGCWIASDKVDTLKEEIGLRLDGFDKLLRGSIIAYGDNEVQVAFNLQKEEPSERRREIRRPVWITAFVYGRTNNAAVKCRVVDASLSGCRLEGDKLDRLPDDVEITIPDLDLPIKARIVWRKQNQAGVSLNWPFEPGPRQGPEDLLKLLEDEEKPKRKQRKRISAYGRSGS